MDSVSPTIQYYIWISKNCEEIDLSRLSCYIYYPIRFSIRWQFTRWKNFAHSWKRKAANLRNILWRRFINQAWSSSKSLKSKSWHLPCLYNIYNIMIHSYKLIEPRTNNEAEYEVLVAGLEEAFFISIQNL